MIKQIKGFEDLYTISDNGIIYTSNGKEKKSSKDRKGYLHITLSKNGIKYSFLVHRLVAENFINNPNNDKYVNHINGLKDDNRVLNLEWCSNSYNLKHAYKTNLKSAKNEKNSRVKVSNETIKNIREDFIINKLTRKELAIKYNISYSHIVSILLNKRRLEV